MAGVTIGCKLPNGFLMTIYKGEPVQLPRLGGGTVEETRAVPIGTPIKINGPAVPHGQRPAFVIAGGYALTPDVPADVAKAWFEQNKHSAMVKNEVVIMHDKDTKGAAKERLEIRSGLEPLDVRTKTVDGRTVQRDPRWPPRANPNLSGVASDVRDTAA